MVRLFTLSKKWYCIKLGIKYNANDYYTLISEGFPPTYPSSTNIWNILPLPIPKYLEEATNNDILVKNELFTWNLNVATFIPIANTTPLLWKKRSYKKKSFSNKSITIHDAYAFKVLSQNVQGIKNNEKLE